MPNLSIVSDNAKPHPCKLDVIRRRSSLGYLQQQPQKSQDENGLDDDSIENNDLSDTSLVSVESNGGKSIHEMIARRNVSSSGIRNANDSWRSDENEQREEKSTAIRVMRRPCRWSPEDQSLLACNSRRNKDTFKTDFRPSYPTRQQSSGSIELFVSSFDSIVPIATHEDITDDGIEEERKWLERDEMPLHDAAIDSALPSALGV
jgi:hypothetical protein